jgi:hypothetical protein
LKGAMMSGVLIAHRGAVEVEKQRLYEIAAPVGTKSWKPIPHGTLVDALGNVLTSRGLEIRKESYAIQREGNVLYGVIDLNWGGTAEYFAAIGLRTSNDRTFCLQIAIGLRVLVCDNLSFHGDLIALKRKHTANLNLLEELNKAVLRYEMGYQQYQHQIEYLRGTIWHPKEARDRIYTAFVQKIIPVRLFHDVATPYLYREEACTAFEVLNSFTHAMKKLKPSVQFDATVRLGRFFSQTPCVLLPNDTEAGVIEPGFIHVS